MPTTSKTESLSRKEQIIRFGVDALGAELKDHPDVLGVGFGYKRTQGQLVRRSTHEPLPCLKVYVYRKGDLDSEEKRIPERFAFRAGEQRRIVPTDVETVTVAESESANLRPSPRIQGGGHFGSFAGVLRRSNQERSYLLTARHVVEDILPAKVTWDLDSFPETGEGKGLLPLDKHYRDPNTQRMGFFDAAVVHILEKELLADSTKFAWSDEVLPWAEALQVPEVHVYGANGKRFATFDASLPTGWPVNTSLGVSHYWRLISFRFQGPTTDKGDSGAPVISHPEGKLVGIHVARQGGCSLVLPAADVMEKLQERLGQGWALAKSA